MRLARVVERLEATGQGWRVHHRPREQRPGELLDGDALLLTPPAPQTLALLEAGEVPLAPDHGRRLRSVTFDACITVLAVPDTVPALPARGAIRLEDGEVAWLTDNVASGASAAPAVTIHGAAAFSRDRFDAPDHEVGPELVARARATLGTGARWVHVHRWRYAAPQPDSGEPAVLDTTTGAPLAVAGDALAGGRVEGAALSGLGSADALRGALATCARSHRAIGVPEHRGPTTSGSPTKIQALINQVPEHHGPTTSGSSCGGAHLPRR